MCLDFCKSTISSLVFKVSKSRYCLNIILSDAESPPCRLTHCCYQAYCGRDISIFDDGVGGVDRAAVMGEKGVEEGAEDTPLWSSSVQDEGG